MDENEKTIAEFARDLGYELLPWQATAASIIESGGIAILPTNRSSGRDMFESLVREWRKAKHISESEDKGAPTREFILEVVMKGSGKVIKFRMKSFSYAFRAMMGAGRMGHEPFVFVNGDMVAWLNGDGKPCADINTLYTFDNSSNAY